MNSKAQLNISFGWLFAIIIGAAILAFAIFGATKMIKSNKYEQQAEGAQQLGILLNPLETGYESASSTPLTTTLETKIYNDCNSNTGVFGTQGISISEYNFKRWSPPGVESTFENKYIFSKNVAKGKTFYVLSKQFSFPFKIADLMILTSSEDRYCFDNPPSKVEDEISNLNQKNLAPNCSEEYFNYTKICFTGNNCDINVDLYDEVVNKGGKEVSFVIPEDDYGDKDYSLMYAAIFSDKENYDCQIIRIIKRMKELASIYQDKASLLNKRGCQNDLGDDLEFIINYDGENLKGIENTIEDLQRKNSNTNCELW